MGLSASQARYLQLTARRNDNEYEAQQINNSRSAIADKMEAISLKYTQGINNRELLFVTPVGDGSTAVNSTKLTYNTITAEYPEGLGYQLIDKYGTEVRPNEKTATALREQAKKDLAEAKTEKVFRVPTKNDAGEDTYTEINGSNFNKFLGAQDTVMNANGQIVDAGTFQNNIKGLNATQFNKYWNTMGFSLASGTKMSTMEYQDPEKLEQAQLNYKAKLAEADEIENKSCIYDDRCLDSSYLENQLRTGDWTLQKLDPTVVNEFGEAQYVQVNYSSVVSIEDVLDTSDDAAVINEYETQMDYYEKKDKQLELQLQRLETSHNALQTEIDSVKKVIDKNVEKSFKTFG